MGGKPASICRPSQHDGAYEDRANILDFDVHQAYQACVHRNELQQMQQQADKNKVELDACEKEVAEMEAKIQQYKEQLPGSIERIGV